MKSSTQRWLHRETAGAGARLAAAVVARLAARRAARPRPPPPDVATWIVGSLSIGGAGKTPVVAWLARRALAAGRRVAIVGHGYRGTARAVEAVEAPDAARFGDEASALRRALPPAVAILVGPRAEAARRIARDVDLVLVDGGFQDPAVARTLDLVVVDVTAAQRVLPAGPLREPLSALSRAGVVWLHKVDEPGARLDAPRGDVRSRVAARALVLPDGRRVPPEALARRAVAPLCAIGRPDSFLHTLHSLGARLEPGLVRADHERFGARALARLARGDALVVTTTKDRERLPAGFPAAVLEIDLAVEPADLPFIDELLACSGR